MSGKCIIIIGTTDTKGEELRFLREEIEQRQFELILLDVSMGTEPPFEAEVRPEEIAKLGGMPIEEIRLSNDRNIITQVMEQGTVIKVRELHAVGKVGGIMAVGGTTMALTGSDVMGPMGAELVPIAKKSHAETFVIDHGGESILRYDEITSEELPR